MIYPCNYGYATNACDDGDPLDALVITPYQYKQGMIAVRPQIMRYDDETGLDQNYSLTVPKLTNLYDNIKTVSDLPSGMLDTIEHFFTHYKDLEKGKWVKVDGWEQVDAAKHAIMNAIKAYNETDAS